MTTTTITTIPLTPGRWDLDANHSSVGFTIRHLGVSKVRGRFTRFETEVVIGENLETTSLVATVDVSSLDTGNADRDAHVLSPDLLDVAVRPTLAFRSTAVRADGDDWVVEGDLTIGGVTRPVALALELGGLQEFPGGGPRHAGFEATTEIRRSDFGIDLGLPPGVGGAMLGEVVKIELDVQLLEPTPGSGTTADPTIG